MLRHCLEVRCNFISRLLLSKNYCPFHYLNKCYSCRFISDYFSIIYLEFCLSVCLQAESGIRSEKLIWGHRSSNRTMLVAACFRLIDLIQYENNLCQSFKDDVNPFIHLSLFSSSSSFVFISIFSFIVIYLNFFLFLNQASSSFTASPAFEQPLANKLFVLLKLFITYYKL